MVGELSPKGQQQEYRQTHTLIICQVAIEDVNLVVAHGGFEAVP